MSRSSILVRHPGPATIPLYVRVVPGDGSRVPPEEPRLIPRLALSVNPAVVTSVPPLTPDSQV